MSYMDEADEPHFDRPEILIVISDAATRKIVQIISLPARRIDLDVAAASDGADAPARISR